jgi:hypothetical protein
MKIAPAHAVVDYGILARAAMLHPWANRDGMRFADPDRLDVDLCGVLHGIDAALTIFGSRSAQASSRP